MFIEDLTKLPPGHPPSPYNFPIQIHKRGKWGEGILPDGLTLYTVGWVGNTLPNKGETPSRIISRLWEAYELKLVISDGTQGWHDCELCSGKDEWYPGGKIGPIVNRQGRQLRIYGHGHFLIRLEEFVYLCPALILHYILDHEYKPPDGFIDAVNQGSFLTLEDLIWIENFS